MDLELQSAIIDKKTETAKVKTKKFKQYVAALSVTLGTLCAGTVMGWTSPILDQLSLDQNITNPQNFTSTDQLKLTNNEIASISGVLSIGAVFALPTGYLADKFGRKKMIISACLTFFLSDLVIVVANKAVIMTIGRFIAGLATGAISILAPMYIGEIAETSIRGNLASFVELSFALGIFISWLIGSFTTWVTFTLLLSILALFTSINFIFMPESPLYLLIMKQPDEAERVLRELRGMTCDVKAEIEAFQEEIALTHENAANIPSILKSKANRRALMIGSSVLILQQLSGINGVVFYAAPIFKAAGSSLSPDLISIILGIVQVIVSYTVTFFIEKAGRKVFLIASSIGMLVFLTLLGFYFHLKQLESSVDNIGFLPVTSSIFFLVFFCSGYGPIPWVLLSEIFAPEIRGIGNSFVMFVSYLSSFVVTFLFPIINSSWGIHVIFYIFAVSMAFSAVFVYYFIPETRGKSLPEIQIILSR